MPEPFSTLISVFQQFLYALAFVGSAAVAFLVLQQPRIKPWMLENNALVRIVAFIALTGLLLIPVNSIISDLFALQYGLGSLGSGLSTAVQCLGGLLGIVCLVGGAWLLAQRYRTES